MAFRIRNLEIDTSSERVLFVHERAVRSGEFGFLPLDRVRLVGTDPATGERREINATLNFCRDALVGPHEIGLSDIAFRDLGLPEGSEVRASVAPAPESVEQVRAKLAGRRLSRADFDAILADVVRHRYSKVELAMLVLACALRHLDETELIDFTRAMIETGSVLDFGRERVADKHCVGGVPGNRTTLVVVPVLASLGVLVPKTSSRAITSPAGTADTMAVLADVALDPQRMHDVVARTGACIAWGGALALAPADDILITVERPMGIDTVAQMVASILAKKKAAGATHALIDVPIGPTAKVRSREEAVPLERLFRAVAAAIGLGVEVVCTDARGPIGRGIGPRLEALDVLAVLRREEGAPRDLREKSLYLAGRILEMLGLEGAGAGYHRAQEALDSGAALRKLDEIIDAQGRRELPPPAAWRHAVRAPQDGRIRAIDCWMMAKVAKLAGAPTNAAAGVWVARGPGDVVRQGEPLFEIHAQTEAHLEFAREYAAARPELYEFGF